LPQASRRIERVERSVRGADRMIHPVLGPVMVGLLGLGSALDIVARTGAVTWLSFYIIALGVAFGSWCAIFALLDWICFADQGKSGPWGLDGIATAIVAGLYGAAVVLRADSSWHSASSAAMVLEVAGAALIANKAWIGRELAASLAQRG
jgi:hypothetical protein